MLKKYCVIYAIQYDFLSVLIWVQTVCKGYQQMTIVAISMERVKNLAPYMQYNTCMYRVPPRHQSTSSWGAYRRNIVVIQDDSLIRQGIYIGCWYLLGTMETYIIIALPMKTTHSFKTFVANEAFHPVEQNYVWIVHFTFSKGKKHHWASTIFFNICTCV